LDSCGRWFILFSHPQEQRRLSFGPVNSVIDLTDLVYVLQVSNRAFAASIIIGQHLEKINRSPIKFLDKPKLICFIGWKSLSAFAPL
jgi:hypothetical protein